MKERNPVANNEDSEPRLIAETGDDLLRRLIELRSFWIAKPMPTRHFLDFCKKRDLPIAESLLEAFERLDLFHPLFRVELPLDRRKYRSEGNRIVDCGRLEEGERWDDKIRERYVQPDLHRDDLLRWLEEGYLIATPAETFQPWNTFFDNERGRHSTLSYYSPYQIYPLAILVRETTFPINATALYDRDENSLRRLVRRDRRWAKRMVEGKSSPWPVFRWIA